MNSLEKYWYTCIIGLTTVFITYLLYINNKNSQPAKTSITIEEDENVKLESFLRSKARHLLSHQPPRYLAGYKNPCIKVPYSLLKKTTNMSGDYPSHVPPDESCVLCLPTVFHVGVCKTGSSDFHLRVSHHQDMYSMRMKEPSFFSSKQHTPHYPTFLYSNWTYTVINYLILSKMSALDIPCRFYTSIFNYSLIQDSLLGNHSYGKYMILSDSTPFYSASLIQSVPQKIRHFIPNAKIIFSVRDPVERMLSEINYHVKQFPVLWEHFNMTYGSFTGENLHERIFEAINSYKACKLEHSEVTCTHSYSEIYEYEFNSFMYIISLAFRHSLYHIQLKKYLYVFPKEAVLVVDMHDYGKDPEDYIEKTVLPFLGLGPYKEEIKQRMSREPPLNKNTAVDLGFLEKTKLALAPEFREMSEQFSAMLGGRQFSWYERPVWRKVLGATCTSNETSKQGFLAKANVLKDRKLSNKS